MHVWMCVCKCSCVCTLRWVWRLQACTCVQVWCMSVCVYTSASMRHTQTTDILFYNSPILYVLEESFTKAGAPCWLVWLRALLWDPSVSIAHYRHVPLNHTLKTCATPSHITGMCHIYIPHYRHVPCLLPTLQACATPSHITGMCHCAWLLEFDVGAGGMNSSLRCVLYPLSWAPSPWQSILKDCCVPQCPPLCCTSCLDFLAVSSHS